MGEAEALPVSLCCRICSASARSVLLPGTVRAPRSLSQETATSVRNSPASDGCSGWF